MSLRILIIDDEESIRESLAIYFRDKGYQVTVASDPSACNSVKTGLCSRSVACADIVIVDQWMPVMTGIEFLSQRHVRECRSAGQHTALMSANLSDSLKEQAIQLGCRVFEKPVRLDVLDEWIAEVA